MTPEELMQHIRDIMSNDSVFKLRISEHEIDCSDRSTMFITLDTGENFTIHVEEF